MVGGSAAKAPDTLLGSLMLAQSAGVRSFRPRRDAVEPRIAVEMQQISMLRILLATSERALEVFRAAGNPVDREFVADLERIVERTRAELDTSVGARSVEPS